MEWKKCVPILDYLQHQPQCVSVYYNIAVLLYFLQLSTTCVHVGACVRVRVRAGAGAGSGGYTVCEVMMVVVYVAREK